MADWIDNLDKDQLENANLIAEEAKKAGIPPNLAVSIAFKESNLRHQSDNKITTSKKGALGIMQLMPATAKGLGVDPTIPEENVRGGVSMLKRLVDKYNDYELAGAAYNAGEGRVDRALRSGNLAGLPGMSVPVGFSQNLPVGMQIIGNYFSEQKLLKVAHRYQQVTDWHARSPGL